MSPVRSIISAFALASRTDRVCDPFDPKEISSGLEERAALVCRGGASLGVIPSNNTQV